VLYWLFIPLVSWFQGFNLFRYISFRAAFAAILSFFVVVVAGPGVLAWLRSRRLPEPAAPGSRGGAPSGRYGTTPAELPGDTTYFSTSGNTSSMVSSQSRVRVTSGARRYSAASALNRDAAPVASAMRAAL